MLSALPTGPMQRSFLALLCFLQILAGESLAQDAGGGLRGSVDMEDNQDLPGSDAPEVSESSSPVYALRRDPNEAVAERGSDGLGTAGRVVPARPFSDRLEAVRRTQSSAGAPPPDGVFGGDTSFDAPNGIRLGTFTILPEVSVTGGWTDNTSQTSGGSGGQLYRITPNVTATSDWARHELSFALRGTYVGYPDASGDNTPSLSASSALRLDLNSQTTANGSVSYSYSREDASSAESSGGSDDIHNLSGSLGVTRDAGLVAVTLRGGLDRNIYTSDDGGAVSSGRDNSLYSASLRLDSNAGGSFSPFVEGSYLHRRYDRQCSDSLCEKRDANGYEMRGGLAIATGPKLSGEIGAGWRVEKLDDQRLKDLSGLVADATLVWSPSRLTTITGGLGTRFEATDIDGSAGSIIYSGDVRIAHEFSDRFVGEAGVGYSYRTYQGVPIEEKTYTGLVGMTYAMTRNVALQLGYNYRKFEGADTGSGYTENAVEAGVRFRH